MLVDIINNNNPRRKTIGATGVNLVNIKPVNNIAKHMRLKMFCFFIDVNLYGYNDFFVKSNKLYMVIFKITKRNQFYYFF